MSVSAFADEKAEIIKDTTSEAAILMDLDEYEEAYLLLKKWYYKGIYDNQLVFMLGISARETGNPKESIVLFKQILEEEPTALRVRLELARSYYITGDMKAAKREFLTVKAARPPKKIGDNIDKFLTAIKNNQPKYWSLRFSAGYKYDSNFNAGPSIDTVEMYNTVFTLSDTAKKTGDHAFFYSVDAEYNFPISKDYLWENRVSANKNTYNDTESNDSVVLSLATGPGYRTKNMKVSLPLTYTRSKFGKTDPWFTKTYTLSPQVAYNVSKKLQAMANLSVGRKEYYDRNDKRTTFYSVAPGLKYYPDSSSFIQGGLKAGRETSKTEYSTNKYAGFNFGYYKALTKSLSFYGAPSIMYYKYRVNEPAYDAPRKDRTLNVYAQMAYYIPKIHSSVTVATIHTQNKSNLDIYTYIRNQYMMKYSVFF